MENHPIPQDITGFKFRLIGSMTVKQFAYLLAAGIMSYIFYSADISIIIKIPFICFFAVAGLSLAFIPIDGRPMDKMILNFIKTIPRENQFIYRRKGISFLTQTHAMPAITRAKVKEKAKIEEARAKKNILLSQLRKSFLKPDEIELDFINRIKPFLEESVINKEFIYKEPQNKPKPTVQPVQKNVPQKTFNTNEAPDKKTGISLPLQKTITSTTTAKNDKITPQLKATPPPPQQQTATIQPMINKNTVNLTTELQKKLDKQAQETEMLQKKLMEMQRLKFGRIYKPTEIKEVEKTPNVKIINQTSFKQAGFPMLPDIPNIILGIVKDPRGKVLQNIIVEVVNAHNIPVRAFKTNSLGQFISATPLPNGTYRVYFEDPLKLHEFDTVEVTLKGIIFSPLEIISVDAREKLRRDLFGN